MNRRNVAIAFILALIPISEVGATPASAEIACILHKPGNKIENLVFVGNSGQIYQPLEGPPHQWQRTSLGGVAATIRGAVQDRGQVFVVGRRAPIFRNIAGIWHTHPLANRGTTTASNGGASFVAAVGRHLYSLRKNNWVRIGSTLRSVSAVWASNKTKLYLAMYPARKPKTKADHFGIIRRYQGHKWAQFKHPMVAKEYVTDLFGVPGKQVLAITSNRRVLNIGAGNRKTATVMRAAQSLKGMKIHARGSWQGVAVMAVQTAAGPKLVTAKGKTLQPLLDLPPLASNDRISVLYEDPSGALLVATWNGAIHIRNGDTWNQGVVHPEVPKTALRSFPHSAPAHAQ